ncbi:7-cyano-7-deazaguanine synthase [Jatrophihabitans lederbergiae]|uniref:7-cyano-7-deazaguanine synthase n=1 Tax=Jatrophihabitans lederbergiae TaxID=3075547 RepID=A0ABU2JEI9_9ACTN|nr:7-cyano-7-deazaguanine synthase [Jatrophihabitans sp. DSM 44399]MDT0263418.1 7-cyano-7-deazaguanine synthase [Jatrophihabitans sp. DSM 44399]
MTVDPPHRSLGARPELLLLSGGLDSAALAAWRQPSATLFIDYGQRPAIAEARAAAAVASELGLHHDAISVDAPEIGGGLLVDDVTLPGAPSPEWWPYRNQLLVTVAAAWALRTGRAGHTIVVGSIVSDGSRHADGTRAFYDALDTLLCLQEGDVSVSAPALELESAELVKRSNITDSVLGWTHSCHRANYPCAECPGCYKRAAVLLELNRLQ